MQSVPGAVATGSGSRPTVREGVIVNALAYARATAPLPVATARGTDLIIKSLYLI